MIAEVQDSVAFVFPGQGSQSEGMLDSFAAEYPAVVDQSIAEANDALGYDLGALIHQDSDAQLGKTEVTQPAILLTSVVTYRIWKTLGGRDPAMMAGHSLGEYSALVCAGALSLAEGVALVRDRGALMQQAVPEGEGAMAAILGLTDEQIIDCCESVDGEVAPANFNAPGQVVIAGQKAAVDTAIEVCKAAGAKRALPVAMSVPSHSTLMKGAAEALAERLAAIDLRPPSVPIVHNVDASTATTPEDVAAKLKAQLYSPVRWTDCATELHNQGINQLVECGPGKVLCGLQKRINKTVTSSALGSPEQLNELRASLS